MDTFLSALFFLPYASGFVVAILLSLRPGPIAVTVLIAVMVTALPLAIVNTRGSGGGDGGLDFTLILFILVLAYAGLFVGFVTRLALWFFFSSSTSRSHKWRRSALMLTSLMFLPGLLLVLM